MIEQIYQMCVRCDADSDMAARAQGKVVVTSGRDRRASSRWAVVVPGFKRPVGEGR